MPYVALTAVQGDGTYLETALAGTTGTSDGWTFTLSGSEILVITNTDGGGAHTATFIDQTSEAYNQNIAISIPLTSSKVYWGWPSSVFGPDLEIDLEGGQESNLKAHLYRFVTAKT